MKFTSDSLQSRFEVALLPLVVKLGKTSFHHVLDFKLFHAKEVEDHGVGQAELGLQLERFSQHDSVQIGGLVVDSRIRGTLHG
jgi:hypothetical protein